MKQSIGQTQPGNLEEIWGKGRIIEGYDPGLVRQDCTGAWMLYNDYGDRNSPFGWSIDHIYPKYLGGDDNIANLRPMQIGNCESKGNDYPGYIAAIVAKGNANVEEERSCIVSQDLQEALKKLYQR